MSAEEPIPELLQAEWDDDQVLALFADLAAGAEVEHVQVRTKSFDMPMTLAEAESRFATADADTIQVRYRFEGELWSDTIMPGEVTTKIIRIRLT